MFYKNMRKAFHVILLAASLCMSCQQNEVYTPETSTDITDNYIPGKACIKVSEELSRRFESGVEVDGFIPGAAVRRTFAHGGRYEERMRRSGLHLWYDVEFDETMSLTKAGESLRRIDGVDIVEYMPVMRSAADHFFNDPDLKKQWHYKNAGNLLTGLEAGCDINVVPAWERGVVGNEKVVVAVIDGGIDINHEDLKDNLWVGTDPDGKPIYGYDFVYESYIVSGEDHGTHVAGTIAAVNNNGIGVSGIAGGDAAKGIKGVRLMSCQIFSGKNGGNSANAIVWAANNGAHIAQNSWGFAKEDNPDIKDTPKYVKDAIDYFNQFAGCDENGEQLPDSPMKGGVVIFAAGNEALPIGYPASYPGCVAVSSVAGDYKLAYYSNFGDWVDIAAPGGDTSKNHPVFSTVTKNSYAGMQGTSMACPHVSGVAALILSEFGGPGFTREDLIDRLLKTATQINLPADEMGAGLVNASAATAHYGEDLPNVPAYAKYEEISGTSLQLKYIVPEDNNGVECRKVELYYSEKGFSAVSEGLETLTLTTAKLHAGDTLVFAVENLDFNTTYNFSVRGVDAFGNTSDLTENVVIRTRDNLPPAIEAMNGTEHVFRQHEQSRLKFKVTDPENRLKEVRYVNATSADSMTKEGDVYVVSINAREIAPCTYESKVVAEDEDGRSSECVIVFEVKENHAPALIGTMENVIFTAASKSKQIDLADYIADEDGESLTYSVESSSPSVVKASVSKNTLTLNSTGFGQAEITVTASDAMSKSVKASFKVMVRDGSKPFDVYPNPVTDGKLYVRSGEAEDIEVQIVSASGAMVHDSMVASDPFAPAVIDMSSMLSGVYNVKVTSGSGKVFTQNVVKL